MDIQEFCNYADRYINTHLPSGWWWKFDDCKRRLGACYVGRKLITFSRHLPELNTLEVCKDTILHEIAHGLVPIGSGHNWVWKRKARELGAKPRSCSNGATIPTGRYLYTCENGHTSQGYRKPKYIVYRCNRCNSKMRWKDTYDTKSVLDGLLEMR